GTWMTSPDPIAGAASRLRRGGGRVTASPRRAPARRRWSAYSRPAVWLTAGVVTLNLLLLLPVLGLVYHIYFDRRGLPDLGPFIRFEFPTIGRVYGAH